MLTYHRRDANLTLCHNAHLEQMLERGRMLIVRITAYKGFFVHYHIPPGYGFAQPRQVRVYQIIRPILGTAPTCQTN